MKLASVLLILVLSVMPDAAPACSVPPVLTRDLERSAVIATGVIHIVRSEQRPLTGDGYEIEGVAELRDPQVLRNRGRHRAPYQFHFGFHYSTDCAFGHLPADGAAAKVWLYPPRTSGGPLELFFIEDLPAH